MNTPDTYKTTTFCQGNQININPLFSLKMKYVSPSSTSYGESVAPSN